MFDCCSDVIPPVHVRISCPEPPRMADSEEKCKIVLQDLQVYSANQVKQKLKQRRKNYSLMLGHDLRYSPNINSPLSKHCVFAVFVHVC